MEIKRNEATLNRPMGDRVIDAPYVFTDIPTFIRQLKDEEAWEKNDRNGITVFKTNHLAIVVTVLHKGAILSENEIDGLVSIQVLEGKVKVTTADGDFDLREMQLVNLHHCQQHSIEALKDSALLITNCSVPAIN
ncbi:MAG TPA: hypothetical protein VLJ68_12615 [Chitinophagaceae bacterium]|nr:hypothetical protein [Chitinophagaceae bacterium]